MDCSICEDRFDCKDICEDIEKQLPGPQAGGMPGETYFMKEEDLEYYAHKHGIHWDDLSPQKLLLNDREIDIMHDYRLTEFQQKIIYCRFYLDLTWKETRELIGATDHDGSVGNYWAQIKKKVLGYYVRTSIWEQIKDLNWQDEYESVVAKPTDKFGGMKMRSVANLYYKKHKLQSEIATELNVSETQVKKRFQRIKKIIKKNGVTDTLSGIGNA